ncbi:site-specific integrase [Dehalococcoidia bacterium]|nr:site-specific integrase [Dehalococcoidia bacterium]
MSQQLELPIDLPRIEREEKDLKIYLTPEEVERILSLCQNQRDRLVIRMLWRTGLRISELLSLSAEDVDWERATLTVASLKRKDQKKRIIPIDRETLSLLDSCLQGRRRGRIFSLTPRRVQQILNQLGKEAGIEKVGDPTRGKARKLHPHALRHSFAVHWIERLGAERIAELQTHLGHKKLETTSRYLRFSPSALHKSYDRLWEEEGRSG